MSSFKDISGRTFGRLLVIKRIDNDKWENIRWLCLCDCGKEKTIRSGDLKRGRTKSCGCLRKELMTTHGHKSEGQVSRTYMAWQSMIKRCTNPNDKAYHNYGGRGIKVCKRWMKFENFLEDMGEPPTQEHSIDRIDNDGNYCKANCQWAIPKEQARNRRNNLFITYRNKTQLLIQWAEEYQISYYVLWERLFKLGWSIEKALTTPVRKRRK